MRPPITAVPREGAPCTRFVNPIVHESQAPFTTYDQVIPGVGGEQNMPTLDDMVTIVEG